MRWLLFLSRIAFVCNLFSIFAILLMWRDIIQNQVAVSTIIIIGYFLAIVFNPIVNVCYIIMLILKKPLFKTVPKWLVLVNFIFLLLQLQYILFLNDTLHH